MGWVDETGDGVDTCQLCGRPMLHDCGSRGTGYPYCGTCGERGALSDSQRRDREPKAPSIEASSDPIGDVRGVNHASVLIHGSALTSPTTAHDVDVIFSGNRHAAWMIAGAWAEAHGLSNLPLDMHESARTTADGVPFFSVPRVPGTAAAYEVIAGSPAVSVREFDGLASLLRMRATPEVIAERIRRQGRARIALDAEGDEWGDYVDGATALRSAIRHARQNGTWGGLCAELPGVMRLAETVSRLCAGRLSAATIAQIRRAGGWVDVSFRGCSTGSITVATHAREGDSWWAAPVYLAEDIERGERPLAVDDRVLVRSARWDSYTDGRIYGVRDGEYLVRIGDDTLWLSRGSIARIEDA